MEDKILNIATQVPALIVVGYIFLQVFKMVLNELGKRMDKLVEAIQNLAMKTETLIEILRERE